MLDLMIGWLVGRVQVYWSAVSLVYIDIIRYHISKVYHVDIVLRLLPMRPRRRSAGPKAPKGPKWPKPRRQALPVISAIDNNARLCTAEINLCNLFIMLVVYWLDETSRSRYWHERLGRPSASVAAFLKNRLGEICQTCQWKQAQESFTRLGVSNAACHARANKPNLVPCLACQVDNGCRCWWWSTQG